MRSLLVPPIPNSPLATTRHRQSYGKLSLRRNSSLDFIENAAFDPSLAMYDANYQNSQAFSNHFVVHMENVLEILKRRFPRNTSIVEVGCGKGDFFGLLERDGHFRGTGYDVAYEGDNPNIEKRYLSADDRLDADLVVLRHVLEHLPRPHEFLEMLRTVFGSSNIYIEVPDFDWSVRNGVFNDVTYEHVNYFSRQSLSLLFSEKVIESGLCFDGQYQYIIANLGDLLSDFAEIYSRGEWEWVDFDGLFPSLHLKIREIDDLLSAYRRGFLWGAATKGCMFLAHCQRWNKVVDKIAFAVDLNPNKWGKYLPGSLVPIRSRADFFEAASREDLLIVSNPTYLDEIRKDVSANLPESIEIVCVDHAVR